MVYETIKGKSTKITLEVVMKLRGHSGVLTEAMVKRYLNTEPVKKKCYKVSGRIVEKYFDGMEPNMVDSIVEQSLIIFHKHFFKCPYHQHGRANTLNQAVRSIKGHDKFQLEVRKCV